MMIRRPLPSFPGNPVPKFPGTLRPP
ncbi:MAG: hypothetical protein JWM80_312, partial [Cyanobacteria bacterium RYN_339]|nr:hypothetical protein [Cyanobacteria bacterium RYN_339]